MRTIVLLILGTLLALPPNAFATSEDTIKMQELQKQIEALSEELEELSERLDKPERHAALDRIEFSGDLRQKVDSLRYGNVTVVEPPFRNGVDTVTGASGYLMGWNLNPDGTFKRRTFDLNNDVLFTSRLRLNMKANVWNNIKFSGRLTMYKNWGDSAGSKVFDSWDTFTMDGTSSGNTTGDYLHVERAYFDWSQIGGTPLFLSIGRRPSTYGPPVHLRDNELRGGTPSGHLVNFNFDGITIGYNLEELTGVPGFVARFCYGQGFESEYGNGALFGNLSVDDTHFGGFNIDLYNDGANFLQLTTFRAVDLTDGFKGTLAVPSAFLPPDFQQALMPGFNMVTRFFGTTNIGDMNLAALGFMREEENGIKWFASLGWTQTDSNGKAGMFGGLLSDAVMEPVSSDGNPLDGTNDIIGMLPTGVAADNEKRDGHSIYVGVQIPAPLGKLGLEYNYGSRYWMPFTQALDDAAGSKLSARGHVGEAYYIFDINPNAFIKVGAIYYDYNYTGSGSPVGKPQDIDEVKAGKAFSLLPAIDRIWDLNASITMKF